MHAFATHQNQSAWLAATNMRTATPQCWPVVSSTLSPPESPSTGNTNTIHVAYRPQMTDRGELYVHFRKFPGFELVGFYDTFCFVRFADRHFAAHAAVQTPPFGCVTYEAAKLNYEVPYPQPQDDHLPPSKTLHVTHLPPNYTKEELHKIFQIFPGFIQIELHGKYGYCYFADEGSSSKARAVLRAQTNLVVSFAKNATRTTQHDLRAINTASMNTPSVHPLLGMQYNMKRAAVNDAAAKYWALMEEQYARNLAAELEEQVNLERYEMMLRQAAAAMQRSAALDYLREFSTSGTAIDRHPISRRSSPWDEDARVISPVSSAGPMTPVSNCGPGLGSANGSPRVNMAQLLDLQHHVDGFENDSVRPELISQHNARVLALERQRELGFAMSDQPNPFIANGPGAHKGMDTEDFVAFRRSCNVAPSRWTDGDGVTAFPRRSAPTNGGWNLFDSSSKLHFSLPQSADVYS